MLSTPSSRQTLHLPVSLASMALLRDLANLSFWGTDEMYKIPM